MSLIRAAAVLGATLALTTSGFTTPAHAQPPGNDEAARAGTIPSVPATLEADTRDATFDKVGRGCVRGRSVWYRYAPDQTSRVRITTIGSTYDAVLAVYSGTRSPRTRVACNDDAAGLQAAVGPRLYAGRQYWIAVSACCGSGAPGGDMVLHLYSEAVPAELTVDITRATAGAVSGRLKIYGTAECATPSVAWINVRASQRADAVVARGAGSGSLPQCTPEGVDWVTRIDTETGWAFRPGLAALDLEAFAADGFSSAEDTVETNMDVSDDPVGRAAR